MTTISQEALQMKRVMEAAQWYAARKREPDESAATLLVAKQFGMTSTVAFSAVFLARKVRVENAAKAKLEVQRGLRGAD